MDLENYYFLRGFHVNFDKRIMENTNLEDIFCTNLVFYCEKKDVDLKKNKKFKYKNDGSDEFDGIYIHYDFFQELGIKIKEIDGYSFFPFLTYENFNIDKINTKDIDILAKIGNNNKMSIGFNTNGQIKYQIEQFSNWDISELGRGICHGTYIKNYPKDKFNDQGIVISVCEKNNYHKLAFCLIKTMRELQINLPIEIFYCGNELSNSMINIFNDLFNVKCIDISLFNKYFQFKGYQIKPFAMLFSSFKEIILLDADSLIFADLKNLFRDKNYLKYGNIFWHDQQNKKIESPNTLNFIKKNIDFEFNILDKYEQCSSMVVFNKKKKWYSLLGICGLNYNFKITFKYLFGDKDTFWLGSELFNQKYYFKKDIGILSYPENLKKIRKQYCEKHGGKKIICDGDKIFLDDYNQPLQINQFKMEDKYGDFLHNISWNFYFWKNIMIFKDLAIKNIIPVSDNMIRIILKYHFIYKKHCSLNINPPKNILKLKDTNNMDRIISLLKEEKVNSINNILVNHHDDLYDNDNDFKKNTLILDDYDENINDDDSSGSKKCIDLDVNIKEENNLLLNLDESNDEDLKIENNKNKKNKNYIFDSEESLIKIIDETNDHYEKKINIKTKLKKNYDEDLNSVYEEKFNIIENEMENIKIGMKNIENDKKILEFEKDELLILVSDMEHNLFIRKKKNEEMKEIIDNIKNENLLLHNRNEKNLNKIEDLKKENIELNNILLNNKKNNKLIEENGKSRIKGSVDNNIDFKLDDLEIMENFDENICEEKKIEFFTKTNEIRGELEEKIRSIKTIQKQFSDLIKITNIEDQSEYDEIILYFRNFVKKDLYKIKRSIDEITKITYNVGNFYINE